MSDYKETPEAEDIEPRQNELNMDRIQGSMQGRETIIPPLSDDAKSKIYEIQALPVEQRRQAVADFHKTNAGKQAGELNGGVMGGGKGVFFRDADGNQHDILYEEDETDRG
jgi:hypothetical protein